MNRISRSVLALGIIVLTSGLLGFLMLNQGHDWGDDFAGYIMQARSLVAGTTEQFFRGNAFTIDHSPITLGLTSYPWGFPLLLAPVYVAFGMDPLAFKLVLTASYMLFLVAFFLLARTRLTDAEALLLTAFMAFNASLLQAQNEIISDLPFLAWSTISLWLVERYFNTPSPPHRQLAAGIALGLTIFMAGITRFNGFLLFVPLAVAQFEHRDSARRLAGHTPRGLGPIVLPYAVFGICYGLQAVLLPSTFGGLQHAFDGYSGRLLLLHAAYYFVVTARLLQESGLGLGVYVVLFTFFVMRLAAFRRQDAPLVLYVLATLAVYILYPPLQGPRFLYPVLPVFLLLAFDGMKAVARRLQPGAQRAAIFVIYLGWVGMAAVSLGVSVTDARQNLTANRQTPSGPFSPAAAAMFSFIRHDTPPDSVVIFFKPRAMRLFTDRDSFLAANCNDLQEGDYLVSMQDEEMFGQISRSGIQACSSVGLASVYDKDGVEVYKISASP